MGSSPPSPTNPLVVQGITRVFPISSCCLRGDDIRRLYQILASRAQEAAARQSAILQPQQGQTPQQFQQFQQHVKSLLELVVRVQGANGEWTAGTSPQPISEDSLPTSVTTIEYNSAFLFRSQYSSAPQNHFRVLLNFTKPGILDLSNPPTGTQEQNMVEVTGTDTTWVRGVTEELKTFFNERSTLRGWLHFPHTYDILVLLLGFPASFYLVYRIDFLIGPLLNLPNALFVALYVYLVLVGLFCFRILFNYARWVLPRIEGPARGRAVAVFHKTVLSAIALALLTRLVFGMLAILGIHLP